MTPQDRLRVSIISARYLDALEREDDNELTNLWELAANHLELIEAFNAIDAGLVEEQESEEQARIKSTIEATLEKHLPSAKIAKGPIGPITVADVANELFRHTPDRLPAESHSLNDRLRKATQPLPMNLRLSKLIAWAEAIFGTAAPEYWKSFQQAAIKLESRRSAEVEYQLAARAEQRPKEGS